MAETVEELEQLLEQGQRPNRYRVRFTLPAGVAGDTNELRILSKSATIPGIEVGQIDLKRNGVTRRIRGDSMSEATWTVTFQVPKKAEKIVDMMYEWSKLKENYKTDMYFDLLDTDNAVAKTIKISGCWISNVPGISTDADTSDEILELEVTFSSDNVDKE